MRSSSGARAEWHTRDTTTTQSPATYRVVLRFVQPLHCVDVDVFPLALDQKI